VQFIAMTVKFDNKVNMEVIYILFSELSCFFFGKKSIYDRIILWGVIMSFYENESKL